MSSVMSYHCLYITTQKKPRRSEDQRGEMLAERESHDVSHLCVPRGKEVIVIRSKDGSVDLLGVASIANDTNHLIDASCQVVHVNGHKVASVIIPIAPLERDVFDFDGLLGSVCAILAGGGEARLGGIHGVVDGVGHRAILI